MTHYADKASFLTATLLVHEKIADETWRMRLECPSIAHSMVPGQFVMVRIDGLNDPLIGRALAMFDRIDDSAGRPTSLDLVYLVKGKFTQALSRLKPGAQIGVWGPLGNSFSAEPVEHLMMVAGGVGQTPMLTLGKEAMGTTAFGDPPRMSGYARKVTLCYGARTASRHAGVADFLAAGIDVRLATDDGSLGGKPMLVTELLSELLDEESPNQSVRVACCGPERMMEAIATIASERNIPCEVSLETPMACGIGICFTCVAKVLQPDGEWDYQRTCVDGPVFDATQIVW